jgi:AGZA family xanthine/uracil permease-like MFS transporter
VATSVPAFATATAIVFVACMMARELAEIDWDDVTEFVHGVIIALTMPLTFSIATGIGLGFISYVGIKLTGRRLGDISAAMWLVLITFLIYFLAV